MPLCLLLFLTFCITNWSFLTRFNCQSQGQYLSNIARRPDFSVVFENDPERSEVRRVQWYCTDEDSYEGVVTDRTISEYKESEGATGETARILQRYSQMYNRISQSLQSSSLADQADLRQRLLWSRNVVRFAAEQCDLHGRYCESSFAEAMESLVFQEYTAHE